MDKLLFKSADSRSLFYPQVVNSLSANLNSSYTVILLIKCIVFAEKIGFVHKFAEL